MSYATNSGGGFIGIISSLKPGKDAPRFFKLTYIIGQITTVLLLLNFALVLFRVNITALDPLFGWNILVFFVCIVTLGLYALAVSQKISINRTVKRLLFYMFIPAIFLTAILIGLGYIFRWPGVVGS